MSGESAPARHGRLVELGPDECWELLARHAVGRLVWQRAEMPYVVPVNFAVDDQAVWIRTTPYGEIARTATHRPVAFEVDDIDADTRSGHSVVLSGLITREHRLPPALRDLDTWVSGTRSLPLRIEPTAISGRRLLPG